MSATFTFNGDLHTFLRPRWQTGGRVEYPVTRRSSVKDVIESMGLPHTEVDIIECNGVEVDYSNIVEKGQAYSVFAIQSPFDVTVATRLRPCPLESVRFIVDVNVGRLARYLRMAGFDTLYDCRWDDNRIIELIRLENMIVLTRDLGLLQRKEVQFGRYIRAQCPAEQLREVVRFFGLAGDIKPFVRCLECNGMLVPVAKEKILPRLEPLTKKYYSSFSTCTNCDKLYWQGSHIEKMRQLLSGAGAGKKDSTLRR